MSRYLCQICDRPLLDGSGDDRDGVSCEDCGYGALHIACAKEDGFRYDPKDGFWRCEGCHEEHERENAR